MRILKGLALSFSRPLTFAITPTLNAIELWAGTPSVSAPVTLFFANHTGRLRQHRLPNHVYYPEYQHQRWKGVGAFKVLGPLALKADFADTSGSFRGSKNNH